MRRLSPVLLLQLVLLGGCVSAKQPREIIIVADLSASIDAQARRQMFEAIKQVAQHLHRSDTLTVIPITGDAEADLQGRILHYEVPAVDKRQAYDADLRNVSSHVDGDLSGLEAAAQAHPGQRTDILGTVRVAMAEFSAGDTDKRLIVLSDFLQDDREFDFRTNRRLAARDAGRQLGAELQQRTAYRPSAQVFLGRLRSADYAALDSKRREGISAFWQTLMPGSTIEPDGPQGMLQQIAADGQK